MSSSIKSENRINVYELDGKDVSMGDPIEIVVKNHWNQRHMIVLVVGGIKYTVEAAALKKGIENSINCH